MFLKFILFDTSWCISIDNFCDMLYEANIISDYLYSFDWYDISWIMNLKRFGSKRDTTTEFAWSKWGKVRNFSVRIANVPAEILTKKIPTTWSRRYHYIKLLGSMTFVSCRYLHGTESFLWSCQSLRRSRIPAHFMESEGSFLCSQ
jgi:hypothetical protein